VRLLFAAQSKSSKRHYKALNVYVELPNKTNGQFFRRKDASSAHHYLKAKAEHPYYSFLLALWSVKSAMTRQGGTHKAAVPQLQADISRIK
jgi:hypothetical protein